MAVSSILTAGKEGDRGPQSHSLESSTSHLEVGGIGFQGHPKKKVRSKSSGHHSEHAVADLYSERFGLNALAGQELPTFDNDNRSASGAIRHVR